MDKQKPTLIIGNKFNDYRGEIFFNNEFDMSHVKRFYIIKHSDLSVVRAWQGHQIEHKYFKCIAGKFVIAWKKIDDFSNPNDNNQPDFIILQKNDNVVLSVPPGYANGFKALETDSELIVFSDHTFNEAAHDNIRFDKNLWFDWNRF